MRNLTAVVANTLNPHVRPRDERLALTAATLSISLAAGRIDMTTTNITAHAHALPPDNNLGECIAALCIVIGADGCAASLPDWIRRWGVALMIEVDMCVLHFDAYYAVVLPTPLLLIM